MTDILPQILPFNSRTEAGFQVAATTLLYYEYCITFSQEIQCIWARKFSAVSALFILNRYAFLLDGAIGLVIQVLPWGSYSQETGNEICHVSVLVDRAAMILLYFVLAVMSFLRVYAIWSQNRPLASAVLCVGLLNPCLTAYDTSRLTVEVAPHPFPGCVWGNNLVGIFYVFEVGFALVTELAVLGLTWMKTASARKSLARRNVSPSVVTLLLRDGTLYYIAGITVAAVSFSVGVASPMTDPLISIFISRFLLSLRQAYLSGIVLSSDSLQTNTSIGFASRIVANIGAPVHWTHKEDRGHDDWNERPEENETHTSDNPLVNGLVQDMITENEQ